MAFLLPASVQKSSGLLLAYEQTGFDKSVPGRLPRLLDGWSVKKLVAAGANGIKTLLYYSPFSAPAVNEQKQRWVQQVGAECAGEEVPYFLEIVAYHDDMDEKSREFALVKPEVVTRAVEEFSGPQYQVDILKVGVPVNMNFVGDPGTATSAAYTREQAKEYFRQASTAAKKPFIYLSEGVSNELFSETLALAAEAGRIFQAFCAGGPPGKMACPFLQRGDERSGRLARQRRREKHSTGQRAAVHGKTVVPVSRRGCRHSGNELTQWLKAPPARSGA